VIATGRLLVRPWRDADLEPFAALCADPEVMAHLGPLWDAAQCRATIDRQRHLQAMLGHCFWAVERRGDGAFLGFCGIKPGPPATPIEGLPEIGWRLARHAWGQGYAREAAAACLDWAWERTPWRAVFAITARGNARSWRLMEQLGMARLAGGDFDYPGLAEDDPTRATITYVIHRPEGR
jgi:RimJ/RimL family protein N-acetyltransferase